MRITVEVLAIRAKYLEFKLTAIGKSRYSLTRDGILLGGFQGKISECLAFLDGWQAAKDIRPNHAYS
jgi:hypothetical protein